MPQPMPQLIQRLNQKPNQPPAPGKAGEQPSQPVRFSDWAEI